jgi:two-component system nitrogen regulation sensor histidine kinase NtrY
LTKIISDQVVNPINEFVLLASEKNIEDIDFNKNIKNKKTNIFELNILIEAFSSIIEKLNNSKKEINEHNQFINAIFSQTPYGIFILDYLKSDIIMQNEATKNLLKFNNSDLSQLFLTKVKNLIIKKNNRDIFEESVDLTENISGKIITFLVKIIRADFNYLEKNSLEKKEFFLVIFNNITEHISYEKTKLWVDVAKRITHEIRNPLTPILLSVERLEYKFLDQIKEEKRENFSKYLQNIKKHTLTISNIIDEFVEFGRMPEPQFHEKNLHKIILETIDGAYFDKLMKYEVNFFNEDKNFNSNFLVDDKQIMRMFLNLFKNSYEAFYENSKFSDINLKIKITSFLEKDINLKIEIEDNGPGFPINLIEKMTEPYITTKKKGSGLGLSIVKRIVSDHNGVISFENIFNENGEIIGAKTIISLSYR